MTTPTLWGLRVSPWTERARWALDHHQIRYRYREHTPMLGEPALRWRARARASGRATVPLWIDDQQVLADSQAIARLADQQGSSASLFPVEHDPEIRELLAEVERTMISLRVLVVANLLTNPEAQAESLPAQVPAALRGSMRIIARAGTRFLGRKYAADLGQLDACERVGHEFAEQLRAQLAGREFLFGGRLSYADIACATVINGFAGGDPIRLRKSPGIQRAWTQPRLAAAFPELVAWRDALYELRPKPQRGSVA